MRLPFTTSVSEAENGPKTTGFSPSLATTLVRVFESNSRRTWALRATRTGAVDVLGASGLPRQTNARAENVMTKRDAGIALDERCLVAIITRCLFLPVPQF